MIEVFRKHVVCRVTASCGRCLQRRTDTLQARLMRRQVNSVCRYVGVRFRQGASEVEHTVTCRPIVSVEVSISSAGVRLATSRIVANREVLVSISIENFTARAILSFVVSVIMLNSSVNGISISRNGNVRITLRWKVRVGACVKVCWLVVVGGRGEGADTTGFPCAV